MQTLLSSTHLSPRAGSPRAASLPAQPPTANAARTSDIAALGSLDERRLGANKRFSVFRFPSAGRKPEWQPRGGAHSEDATAIKALARFAAKWFFLFFWFFVFGCFFV